MIPAIISKTHIAQAIRRIHRVGIPSRRKSRGYCLVTDTGHLPPKYTIALAHRAATGEFLSSNRFSGGDESNDFLERLGFCVLECNCGGTVRGSGGASNTRKPKRSRRTIASKRHSERCPECKRRVREMLERIYGTCLSNHTFGWPTGADAYDGTSIGHALREVAAALESYRGFGIADFVKKPNLAPCDFWVPDPGFVVEFDESQHFTGPRKLALEVYADKQSLGFSAKHWMALCARHNKKDNDPPYRDEQRAWYDTLRDLVPTTRGLRPTVRLYARDLQWCSLDPIDRNDRERFSRLIRHAKARASPRAIGTLTAPRRSASTLRVAMVFPKTERKSSNGVPPNATCARPPAVPGADAFAGEAVDFVLFPEGYISASDERSAESLKKLASEIGAPLLVGAIDNNVDATARAWQVLLRFDPNGAAASRVYVKHSTAEAVAFERSDWEARTKLPTLELSGANAGTTRLPRFLSRFASPLPGQGRCAHLDQSELRQRRRHQMVVHSSPASRRESRLRSLHAALQPEKAENPSVRIFSGWPRTPGQRSRFRDRAGTVGMHGSREHLRGRPRHGRGRRASRLVEASPRQQAEACQEGTGAQTYPAFFERRATGRSRAFGLAAHQFRPPGRDGQRSRVRRTGAERADAGCRGVLSRDRSSEANERRSRHLEPLGAPSDRLGPSGDAHDGARNRMLRTRPDFRHERDSGTRGAVEPKQDPCSEGH